MRCGSAELGGGEEMAGFMDDGAGRAPGQGLALDFRCCLQVLEVKHGQQRLDVESSAAVLQQGQLGRSAAPRLQSR